MQKTDSITQHSKDLDLEDEMNSCLLVEWITWLIHSLECHEQQQETLFNDEMILDHQQQGLLLMQTTLIHTSKV